MKKNVWARRSVQALLVATMLPLAGCQEFLANYPELNHLLQKHQIEVENTETWPSMTCIGEVCTTISNEDGPCGEACDEAERKANELLEDPSTEAGEEFGKWLTGELPTVGKPLDVLLRIWEAVKVYEGRHDHFIALLRAMQRYYARGTDESKIDVCKALADLFGYPLTGANLSHCMGELRDGPLPADQYRRIRQILEDMIRRVNADRQA